MTKYVYKVSKVSSKKRVVKPLDPSWQLRHTELVSFPSLGLSILWTQNNYKEVGDTHTYLQVLG